MHGPHGRWPRRSRVGAVPPPRFPFLPLSLIFHPLVRVAKKNRCKSSRLAVRSVPGRSAVWRHFPCLEPGTKNAPGGGCHRLSVASAFPPARPYFLALNCSS
ncbi:hypothetical protein EI94DRAFT_1731113 [Lactarius quietus]|nr:hypothetical protein EI94DRAFT_1731113 [Lactarius quietus]